MADAIVRSKMKIILGTIGVMKKVKDILHTNISEEERSKLQIKTWFYAEVQSAEDKQNHDKIKSFINMQYLSSCKAVC